MQQKNPVFMRVLAFRKRLSDKIYERRRIDMKEELWSDMTGLGIMFLVMMGAVALRAYIWL